MGSATAKRSIRDAVARSDKPTTNAGQAARMTVEHGTVERIPHIQAPAPCPAGCTVLSAQLQLIQDGAAATGSRTLSLRRITEPWQEGTLTWKNRPAAVTTVSASATVSGAGSDGRVVAFDVLADVQAFVDGVYTNFGWTLESSTANIISFSTANAVNDQPQLVVTWANRPETPTDLVPGGNAVVAVAEPILRWAFIDLGGDTTLDAIQVQTNSSSAGWDPTTGFSSPTFDSGVRDSGQPQLALDTTSFAGPSAGGSFWWTVRHRDGAGLWSQWADPTQVTYQPLEAGALTSPGSTVSDTTFPWAWTTASQSKFQVLLRDTNGVEVWSSPVITSSTARSYTQPRDVIRKAGSSYVAVLRLWDAYARQAVPGVPEYVEITQAFTYSDTGTVTGVTGLTVTIEPDASDVSVQWNRATPSDQFTIWLDDTLHVAVDGPSALISGTTYGVVLHDVPPRVEHTLTVKAVTVDGSDVSKSSSVNPTETVYTDPIGVRLLDVEDPDLAVVLLAEPGTDIVSSTMPETSERFEPIGADQVVQVTSALRWFEGTVSGGFLADYKDVTAREARRRVLAMKATPTRKRILVWGRNAVPVYLAKVNVSDVDLGGAERYEVSFEFVAAVPSPEYTLS